MVTRDDFSRKLGSMTKKWEIYIAVIIPVRRWSQWGGLGWGGVGWGWWRSLHLNTSLMLRRWCGSLHMNTSLMLRKLGWGGVGWGWCRSLHMNTSLMLRRTGVGWGWGGVDHWRSENFAGACKQKRQFGETIQTQVFCGRWWQPCREYARTNQSNHASVRHS